jgi:RNA polymerase sigma-70 factor (ECF subfamily)
MRQNKNLAHMSTHVDISNLSIIDTSNDVEKNLLLSENLKLLYRCINQLSLIDRTLVYFYLEDLKYREIAAILGISEKNVSVKLHRIKKLLKQYFKDLEE